MKVTHGRAQGTDSLQQSGTYTGEVWADPVITDVPGVGMYHVFFAPSARTFWHTHGGGQILHVTSGRGMVVSRTTGAAAIRAGDVIWIEPGEPHWHGATKDTYLVHTAISLGAPEWLGAVTDQDYGDAH
jgi:quercetin dioxygenase-like cupin family protein